MSKARKFTVIVLSLSLIVGIGIYLFQDQLMQRAFQPPSTNVEQGVTLEDTNQAETGDNTQEGPDVEVVAEDLEIPWEIAFLPDKSILVTERPGRLLKIDSDTQVVEEIEGVAHVGEGGLMGMALHPDFNQNRYIYLFFTSRNESGNLTNRLERYRYDVDSITNREIILDGIAGAPNHDGGRIEFGPDGYLYITTGDAQTPSLAQNTDSLNGKILRINDDGSIPEDNPFDNAVYSYGHRNPQGIAWDGEGRLWSSEHGPSGLQSGYDELNLIEMGNNYGWPEIRGDETRDRMTTPVIQSGSDDTWAPAGAEFLDNSIFFAGLRGSALYQAELDGREVSNLRLHFREEFGRLRAVRLGPDGYLYITTSNRDGRGSVNEGDDKLIRIHPRVFE